MESSLLRRFRDDRRKLLDFILSSSGLIEPDESHDRVDMDNISADYVLDCVNSGRAFDASKASHECKHESSFPIMIDFPTGSSYYLCSDPEFSGSPPRHAPPKVDFDSNFYSSMHLYDHLDNLDIDNMRSSGYENGFIDIAKDVGSFQSVDNATIPPLELPSLQTGLSDDALREFAYELFLGSMVAFGFCSHSLEDKKKEKKSRLLSRLKSKREKINSQSETPQSHLDLFEVVRSQMQIAEAMDACIRQSLVQLASSTAYREIYVPQVSLELLTGICKYNFPSEKLYILWKKRQANILEELLCTSANLKTDECRDVKNILAIIKSNEQWDISTCPLEHAEVLLTIKKYSSKLSSMPGKFGLLGETFYWTSGYHLNIKLYQKLLSSVFDILDESQLVEEAEEILSLVKFTWTALGITQKIHNALYGWLLLKQYSETGEKRLLDHAILEIQKTHGSEKDEKEIAYISSLVCSITINGSKLSVNLVDAIFMSMSVWCGCKLKDYHLNLSQEPMTFKRIFTLLVSVGMLASDERGVLKLVRPETDPELAARLIKGLIENSVRATCKQLTDVFDSFNMNSKLRKQHPLAMLAHQVKLIAEKESNDFIPVLRNWCPEAGIVSSMKFHKFYGDKLKPFLDELSCLSEDVISVLPLAAVLDWELSRMYFSSLGENKLQSPSCEKWNYYQIGEVSGPILLNWLSTQQAHILIWTDRAFDLEDWEPLSFHQRQAASIIEVFRIIEEAVDQLFGLKLPMNVMHLESLLSIIAQCLETYLQKMVKQLVDKTHLFPASPALTRYEETMISVIKKKSVNCKVLDEEVCRKLKELTVPKLCVRLNTLHYIQTQLGTLEDGIRKAWSRDRSYAEERWAKDHFVGCLTNGLPACSKSIDGMFNVFNPIRKFSTDAINRFCEFIGARIVFWDLRNSFLFHLYRGSVENARLESNLPQIDNVLDHICSVIADPLRDLVVLSIYRSFLDGYIWVLLDGGPSRVFSDVDVEVMHEDIKILKGFFIADEEGLPPAVIDYETRLPLEILHLYSLQTEILIEMLMSASEKITSKADSRKPDEYCMDDAYTLLRVLCHKKDTEASKFLKMHYELPKSSEYEDNSLEFAVSSTLLTDLLKTSASFQWTKNSRRSFKSIKKKLREATSEIMH